ncbi:MAG: hypothetical protein WAZ40_00005 [Minisyncoccia bacterium]
MERDYKKLFALSEDPQVPTGLQASVLLRIEREARRISRIRLALLAPLALASSVSVVVSLQYLAQEIAQSGLVSYLSILFSDSATVFILWKEFSISLAEQVPVFGIIIFMATTLVFVGAVKLLIKNAKTVFRGGQLAN